MKNQTTKLAHLFSGEDVSCQFDLGEVAFADGLQQPVVADVRLVVRRGRGDRVPTPWHAGAAGQLGLLGRGEVGAECG